MTARGFRWRDLPALPLDSQSVHVYRACLDVVPAVREKLSAALSLDELERAGRFHFERDRHRFVVARGMVRAILARYLEVEPAVLEFAYGSHGKPTLAHSWSSPPLCFNVAHSQDLGILAVARSEVGVDIECFRPIEDCEAIVSRYFSPAEAAALMRFEPERRLTAFFYCWTRKEAFIKARGEGLSYPLESFEVTMAPGEPARLLRISGDDVDRWFMLDLPLAPDAAGALVVKGEDVEVSGWEWQGT